MKCNVTDCDRVAHTRGLCKRCYTSAHVWIRKGRTTWAVLEQEGIAFPRARFHRRGRAPLTKALQLIEEMRKVKAKNAARMVFMTKNKEDV